jgi:catechol 2,3-dioxygenase-like lactoylglutathione lyase family enzyme
VLDHVGLNVSDIERSKAFYLAALAPLGYSIFREWETGAGFGTDRPDFWIHQRGRPAAEVHLSFRSPDRAMVDAFYEAALGAGGRDNGPPGPRPQYTRSTTARSCSTPTATTSRRYVTRRASRGRRRRSSAR